MSNNTNELSNQTPEQTDELLYEQILQLPMELRTDIYNIYEKIIYPKLLLRKKRAVMDDCETCIKLSVKSYICYTCYCKVQNQNNKDLIKFIRNENKSIISHILIGMMYTFLYP
jgi:hypothetical protein